MVHGAVTRRAWAYLLVPLALWLVYVVTLLRETGGRLCPSLDDAFIHYQYARSIAEGHPLAYHPGDPPTTGATSLSYVVVLALGWLVGFRGMGMTLFAQLLAVLCLSLAGWAAKRMGDRLIGQPAGLACACVVWGLPQLVFMAFGGMELALVLGSQLLAVSAAVRWCLALEGHRTRRRALGVALLGSLAALTRPEPITGAAAVAFALAIVGSDRVWTRALGGLALAPAGLPGLIARVTTGVGQTNGQTVKWLYADPYVRTEDAWEQTVHNLRALAGKLFTGTHPDHAVPLGFHYLVALGAVLTLAAAVRRHGGRGFAAVLCFLAGIGGIAVPATYWTFDTNLGRYLWPFVPLAAMAVCMGAVALGRWLGRRLGFRGASTALAAGFVALCMSSRPESSLARIVDSATEICEQHLTMVEHVRALPPDAVVAVNDAGALAYLTGHRTYDLVGLTTAGAARAWAHGQGAVFEQLERVPAWRRPRFMAYYPTWLPNLPLGGEPIAHVALPDADHVGGAVMELRRVRTELFQSGDRPVLATPSGRLVDELDVADPVSEAAHDYRLEMASRSECWLTAMPTPDGDPLGDGGRLQRSEETFVLRADAGRPATWIFRTDRRSTCPITLGWNGAPLPTVTVEQGPGWAEHTVSIPADRVRARNFARRRCRSDEGVTVHHDWLYQP